MTDKLAEALRVICFHWDEMLNNVDCGPEFEAREEARAALAEYEASKGLDVRDARIAEKDKRIAAIQDAIDRLDDELVELSLDKSWKRKNDLAIDSMTAENGWDCITEIRQALKGDSNA